ncbi:DUF2160 domain-containing protein [Jannaschia sp. M317]|uniref:DUF2160 domain-containing protein n=1 Tax=Jannaschia sp. M317 TaxID=2867011 RepID=UPI0021A71989|nr:DUF2160 domain-containing protein [Jannaschia sp. M317]UWQ18752.1 DUF2160 domain-containing protein [Jannaschia sp. M317]
MRYLIPLLMLAAAPVHAQNTWGSAAQEVEKGFEWTAPIFGGFWMAWTPATLAIFIGIFSAIAVIGLLEGFKFRDGLVRDGVLGLTTTLGDRLFLSLLGTSFIFLAWLGLFGEPLWGALGLSIAWSIFCFWKV